MLCLRQQRSHSNCHSDGRQGTPRHASLTLAIARARLLLRVLIVVVLVKPRCPQFGHFVASFPTPATATAAVMVAVVLTALTTRSLRLRLRTRRGRRFPHVPRLVPGHPPRQRPCSLCPLHARRALPPAQTQAGAPGHVGSRPRRRRPLTVRKSAPAGAPLPEELGGARGSA